jgi:hypothetical protein
VAVPRPVCTAEVALPAAELLFPVTLSFATAHVQQTIARTKIKSLLFKTNSPFY